MKVVSPIWYEGTLLLPQLFQQQELAQQAHLHSLSQLTRVLPSGLNQVMVDEASLQLNKLKLLDCEVLFQDSTWYDAKQMQYLPSVRDLHDIPNDVYQTTVYLAIAELNTVGSNVSTSSHNTPLRYLKDFVEVPDLYGEQRTEIATKTLNLKLKFEHENRQNFLAVPLFRLIKNQSNQWELDAQYVPPILTLQASDFLLDMLGKQIQIIQSKCVRLSALRKERSQQSADFLVSDVSLFWLLNALNQSLPSLSFFQEHKTAAPESYYLCLSSLVSSLLSFSFEHSFSDVPSYEPRNLAKTFIRLNELLTSLLNTVIPTALVIIDLERLGTTRWLGHLMDSRLDEHADYYLSVRASTPLYDLQDRFPKLCKIGTSDDVERILPSASNGVPLRLMQRLPSALPMRSEAIYFALDKNHPGFKSIIEARSCCIYSPNTFENLTIELYVVPNEE